MIRLFALAAVVCSILAQYAIWFYAPVEQTMIIWGSRPLPFPRQALPAFFNTPALTFSDVTISWMQVTIYVVAIALMIGLNLIITKTRVGTAMGAYPRRDKVAIRQDEERSYELFPVLYERRSQMGGTLSGGEQQMLAIGRALLARPKLLLLDEPSLGLAPLVVENIFEIIQQINVDGVTVMLVEQNAQMALQIAHRGYVLETGRVTLEGPARELLDNPRVRSAYLGLD